MHRCILSIVHGGATGASNGFEQRNPHPQSYSKLGMVEIPDRPGVYQRLMICQMRLYTSV